MKCVCVRNVKRETTKARHPERSEGSQPSVETLHSVHHDTDGDGHERNPFGATHRVFPEEHALTLSALRSPLSRSPLRAHTLPELLLVLTILVMFALIAIPRMASAVMRSRLNAALDAARTDLQYTRARAVGTGLRHQLAVDSSTGQIVVAPYHPEEAAAGVSASGSTSPDVALRDTLPQDVRVVEWTVSPLGFAQSGASAPAGSVPSGAPLTFYPEGTGDSARLVLQDTSGEKRGLLVDGFSGEIRDLTPEEMR